MNNAAETKRKLQVFRAAESLEVDSEIMVAAGVTATIGEGLQTTAETGVGEGTFIRHLFSDPASGLSLVYAWLKCHFQLPIHSHDADCVYCVISGEAHPGNEVLKAGDGFFVPKGARYSDRARANGVEVLELQKPPSTVEPSDVLQQPQRSSVCQKIEIWTDCETQTARSRALSTTNGLK